MRNLFAVLLASIFVAGCAAQQVPVVNVPPSAKTVAIVPSLIPQFRVATTGLTAFENHLDLVDMRSWHLDDVIYSAAASTLSGRFEVSRATADSVIIDTDSRFDKAVAGENDVATAVRDHVHADKPVDLYIVFCASAASHPYYGRPNILEDIGISKLRDPFITRAPGLHTFLLVTVVDGKTFKAIAALPLYDDPTKTYARLTGSEYPSRALDGFDWKDNWNELTDGQHRMVIEQTKSLLSEAVAYTLSRAKFGS